MLCRGANSCLYKGFSLASCARGLPQRSAFKDFDADSNISSFGASDCLLLQVLDSSLGHFFGSVLARTFCTALAGIRALSGDLVKICEVRKHEKTFLYSSDFLVLPEKKYQIWGPLCCDQFFFGAQKTPRGLQQVTAKASMLFSTTASVGVLVASMQNLGLIGMMTVEWPSSLQGVFSVCKFLLLDIDSYAFSCIAGTVSSSVKTYGFSEIYEKLNPYC